MIEDHHPGVPTISLYFSRRPLDHFVQDLQSYVASVPETYFILCIPISYINVFL